MTLRRWLGSLPRWVPANGVVAPSAALLSATAVLAGLATSLALNTDPVGEASPTAVSGIFSEPSGVHSVLQQVPVTQVYVPFVASDPPPPEPTPTPEPVPPPVNADLLALQASLQSSVDNYWSEGEFAIAVTDLQTGEMISANGDTWHFSGCVMNLFAIISVVRDVQAGLYPLDSVDATIAETIRNSNASTALQLYRTTGGGDVVAGLEKVDGLVRDVMHLDRVFLDHPPAFGQYTRGLNPDNWITANDVNRALALLYHGELLDASHTAYLLERMTGVKPGLNYLTAYGNGGITSHKNGFFPYSGGYVDNDAGIVRFQRDGQEYAYAVTFLSMGVPVKYNDIGLAQNMMAQIWNYFDAKYP